MANLPTVYEYYTGTGVTAGLSADQDYFTLNNKNITLYSGAMHYYRVPQEYWRDRLRKMRAAGLNAVETYVPWNLHEPEPGVFDFGQGGTDFQEFLNIEKFLKTAQEEDLLAIVRPGPYICAEWEFGGMPSWLLRDKDMKIRTSDTTFMDHVSRYFSALLSILSALQFTRGGPIIAFQIENEYGNVKQDDQPIDLEYLQMLKDFLRSYEVDELLFTSDTPSNGNWGSLPGILYTANFQDNPDRELALLQTYQPGKPLMVMEYWTGWFDHWTEEHHTRTDATFSGVYESILKFPSSVNMYMFHGGTNWGLMNGANIGDGSTDNGGYQPDTSSYDYDAPLSEAGDYTDKYYSVQKLNEQYNQVKTRLPTAPTLTPRVAYGDIKEIQQLTLAEVLEAAEHHIQNHDLLPMELLPINNNSGQSYGYIVYRKKNLSIPSNATLQIKGRICDSALVLINGKLKSKILQSQADLNDFGYWRAKDSTLNLGGEQYDNATLEIVVENWGRNNFGKLDQFLQHKGLWQGNVAINGEDLFDWEIVPLEFKKKWTNGLTGWHKPRREAGPALYKGILKVEARNDTYVDLRGWNKGIVIVNGFVLSRYLKLGPQQAAYLPAPLLREGDNDIVIFEHFEANNVISFVKDQIYQTMLAVVRNIKCTHKYLQNII